MVAVRAWSLQGCMGAAHPLFLIAGCQAQVAHQHAAYQGRASATRLTSSHSSHASSPIFHRVSGQEACNHGAQAGGEWLDTAPAQPDLQVRRGPTRSTCMSRGASLGLGSTILGPVHPSLTTTPVM